MCVSLFLSPVDCMVRTTALDFFNDFSLSTWVDWWGMVGMVVRLGMV
jgi:hypothetical protein